MMYILSSRVSPQNVSYCLPLLTISWYHALWTHLWKCSLCCSAVRQTNVIVSNFHVGNILNDAASTLFSSWNIMFSLTMLCWLSFRDYKEGKRCVREREKRRKWEKGEDRRGQTFHVPPRRRWRRSGDVICSVLRFMSLFRSWDEPDDTHVCSQLLFAVRERIFDHFRAAHVIERSHFVVIGVVDVVILLISEDGRFGETADEVDVCIRTWE